MSDLVPSEQNAVAELRQRLSARGRAPTLVLAGPIEARLDAVLKVIADTLGGRHVDLATPDALEALKKGPPLYGRDIEGRLSDTALRQFLLREADAPCSPVLAVHVPGVVWKIMTESEPEGPRRLFSGLREWASPCPLVLSYPLGADLSSLTAEDLSSLLAHHLVELRLTQAERRYLATQWKGGRP